MMKRSTVFVLVLAAMALLAVKVPVQATWYPTTAAAVVSLFSGCSGTLVLSADGACHAAGGGAGPGFSAYNSAQQNAGASTQTRLSFDTNEWITDAGMHSTSVNPSRGIATSAGHFYVACRIENGIGSTTDVQVGIYKNGTHYLAWNGPVGTSTASTFSADIVNLALNDYVECFMNTAGAGAGTFGTTEGARMTMVKIF